MAELKPLTISINGVEKVLKSQAQVQKEYDKIRASMEALGRTNISDKEIKNIRNELLRATAAGKGVRDAVNSIDKSVTFANFKRASKTISAELVNIAAVAATSGKSASDNINAVGNSIAGIASQFGVAGAAAGALITLLTPLVASFFELSAAEQVAADASKAVGKELGKELVVLERSFDTLRSATANYGERSNAIRDLQQLLPDYFDDLDAERTSVEQLNDAYLVGNVILKERATQKAFESLKEAQFAAIAEATVARQLAQANSASGAAGAAARIEAQKQFLKATADANKQLAIIEQAEKDALAAIINNLSVQERITVEKAKQGVSNKIEKRDREERAKSNASAAKSSQDAQQKRIDQEEEWQRKSDEAVEKQKKDFEDEQDRIKKAEEEAEAAAKKAADEAEAARKKRIEDEKALSSATLELRLTTLDEEEAQLIDYLTFSIEQRKEAGEEQSSNEIDLIERTAKRRVEIAEEAYTLELDAAQAAYDTLKANGEATEADEVKLATKKIVLARNFSNAVRAIENDTQSKRETSRQEDIKSATKTVETIIEASQDLANTLGEILTQSNRNTIDSLNEQLNEVQTRYSEVTANINALEGDLEGKRGGRRDAVLAGIEQARRLEEALAAEKIALALQIEREEQKIRKREKAAAIANALINGALAITNIFATVPKFDFGVSTFILAGISAATTAAQVALISGQKFAKGGFTGSGGRTDETGHRVAGVVHNDEWVAPKWLVESPQFGGVINELEQVRQRGFAEGGYTTPNFQALNASPADTSNAIVVQALREFQATNVALANRPILVSATEVQNTANIVKQRRAAATL